jgi:hypothetical protein
VTVYPLTIAQPSAFLLPTFTFHVSDHSVNPPQVGSPHFCCK